MFNVSTKIIAYIVSIWTCNALLMKTANITATVDNSLGTD